MMCSCITPNTEILIIMSVTPTHLERCLYLYGRHFPLRKGKMRLVNLLWRKALGGQSPIRMSRLNIGGFTMRCDLSQYLQRQYYFFGTYLVEAKILACWKQFARGAKTIFDVGANSGIYSLASLAASPGAAVHAFEPTHELTLRLMETSKINHISTLRIHELAVTSYTGTAYLNYCTGSNGDNEGMNFISEKNQTKMGTAVKTITLDDFCAENNIDRIDLLKLDVQGCESDVLAGANRLLREKRITAVFTELNWSDRSDMPCPASESLEILSRNGFEFADPKKTLEFKPSGNWLRKITEVCARLQPK